MNLCRAINSRLRRQTHRLLRTQLYTADVLQMIELWDGILYKEDREYYETGSHTVRQLEIGKGYGAYRNEVKQNISVSLA